MVRSHSVQIGTHSVGPSQRPFIVAEMSGNHNGDLGRALAIVDMVADSGAQAVKLQTYRADTITIDCDGPAFRVSDEHELWGGENLFSLYDKAHTPWEWHEPIFERARDRGLVAFSSAFDPTAVDLLESLDVPAYKVASLEIGDVQLLRKMAETGKPIVLSTGAATAADIDLAVRTIRDTGNDSIIVLGCTSSYPASPSETSLGSLALIRDAWDVVVGLSDHTFGIGVSVAAVALGASLIEKHVTLARADGGVDAAFSLEPSELAMLAVESERAWQATRMIRLGPAPSEAESQRLRRSLYVVEDARAGDEVTMTNVRSIRPAGGLEPRHLDNIIGMHFREDVRRGTPLLWRHL